MTLIIFFCIVHSQIPRATNSPQIAAPYWKKMKRRRTGLAAIITQHVPDTTDPENPSDFCKDVLRKWTRIFLKRKRFKEELLKQFFGLEIDGADPRKSNWEQYGTKGNVVRNIIDDDSLDDAPGFDRYKNPEAYQTWLVHRIYETVGDYVYCWRPYLEPKQNVM